MARRFEVKVETGELVDHLRGIILETRTQVGTVDLSTLLNELWEAAFTARTLTTSQIFEEIASEQKTVRVPFNLHEKLAQVIKVFGKVEEAEKFFSELEENTEIK